MKNPSSLSTEGLQQAQQTFKSMLHQTTPLEATTQEALPTPEVPEQAASAAPPSVQEKPLTLAELKSNYINVPREFFERKLSPVQFGHSVFAYMKVFGLGPKIQDVTFPMLGYVFCNTGFSPVEIRVYAQLCFNTASTPKQISKQAKLPVRLVERALTALEEAGLIEQSAKYVGYKLATLEELLDSKEAS